MNAISLPSGENFGWLSLAGWTVSCRASPPADDAIQMSPPQSKASRLPSGDSAGLLARRIGSRAAAGLWDKMTQTMTNRKRFMADLGAGEKEVIHRLRGFRGFEKGKTARIEGAAPFLKGV